MPRIGQKRKVETGWADVTLDQRKSSMASNPPPFDYRWDDATKEAVNVALAAYNGSHMYFAFIFGCCLIHARVIALTRFRYHNFTSGKTHSDASSLRFIESFKVRRRSLAHTSYTIIFGFVSDRIACCTARCSQRSWFRWTPCLSLMACSSAPS